MDIMKMMDLLLVGVPETIVSIIVGLTIVKGNIFKKNLKQWVIFVGQMIISCVVILSVITLSRLNFDSMVLRSMFSIIVYLLSFKFIWRLNLRQSTLCGSLMIMILMACDILALPITSIISKLFGLNQSQFYQYRVIFSIPSRLVEIMFIFIVLKMKVAYYLKNSFSLEWNKLDNYSKSTVIMLNIAIPLSFVFLINYGEIFVKLVTQKVQLKGIQNNLTLFFIETILFLIVSFVIFYRTIRYDKYREVFNSNNIENLFQAILDESSEKEKIEYTKRLIASFEVDSTRHLEEFLNYNKAENSKFNFKIDKQLYSVIFDYTHVIYYIEFVIENIISEPNFLNIEILKESEYIAFKLDVQNTDQLQYRRIMNILNKNSSYKQIKSDLILNSQAKVDTDYHEDNLVFIIKTQNFKNLEEE